MSIALVRSQGGLPVNNQKSLVDSKFIHSHTYNTTHTLSKQQRHLRCSSETLTFYQNYLAMSNTADVTGKPIAVWSQTISDVNAINTLVAFYDIHGRKREVLFFYFVPDTARDVQYFHYLFHYYRIKLRSNDNSSIAIQFSSVVQIGYT
jgi:hypothetical protein